MAKNGTVLDAIRRTIALLECEYTHVIGLAGFIMKPNLVERLEVLRRFSMSLADVSNPWNLSTGRLKDTLSEAENLLGGFRITQAGFLRKVAPCILEQRLKVLSREPWFSYRRAEVLADGLQEFLLLAKGSTPLRELRSSYNDLETLFRKMENLPAEERVSAVLTPEPQRSRPDRKRNKRLASQEERAKMKGLPGGGRKVLTR